jgi:hypothetical protein
MWSLHWGKEITLWVSNETAAILLGSARETKPHKGAENLTIFEMPTVVAVKITADVLAIFTRSYNRKLKHGSDEHDGN